ncbi:MAG: ABC transporter permease subunit, partial [Acidimicrobiales bacterium]
MTGPAPGVPVGVGRVGAARTASLVYGVTVRELLTRGRLIALAVLGVGLIAVGWAIGASESVTDPVEAAVELVANLGFTVVLPVVALVFGSASLGDAREDGTLVYLWLRPVDRLPIVVGAYLAAVTAVVPLTVTPIVVAAALSDGGGEVAAASALASVVGALAYTA